MRKILICFFCLLVEGVALSQPAERPRLVVGIVVDQMRQEYLYRFSGKFAAGGFRRLMNDGFWLSNAHYNYVPTVTGPGHASVYSGTTPAVHGIIGNDWYDKDLKKMVNCVGDDRQKPVGNSEGHGDVSPWRMLSSTITDELKLSSQMRSKVIGISMKDRGAVLPAGHTPDGAYWYDNKTGHFISSTYYQDNLPAWVNKFNALNLADKYLSQTWKTLLPPDQYTESGPDDSPYETKFRGKEKPVFPYNLAELRKSSPGFDMLPSTPFGNDFLTEMAKAALEGESLGVDDTPDFLAVSYSCTDAIGHSMGPDAVELEDTYLRLDRNLQDLLTELDKRVGQGKYTVFLTADHGVADVPQYLMDMGLPGNYFKTNVESGLNDFLAKYFPGKKVVENVSNGQVFLSQELFGGDPKTSGIDFLIATQQTVRYLMATPGVAQVYTESVLRQADYGEKGQKGMIVRGYNHRRSGDVAFILEPGWLNLTQNTGTSHGSGYSYDTNVPILFFGAGIKKGTSARYHPVTDIAPTLSVLLRIKFPSGCTGQPVSELWE